MENGVLDLAKEIVLVKTIKTPSVSPSDTTRAQRDIINDGFGVLKRNINKSLGGRSISRK